MTSMGSVTSRRRAMADRHPEWLSWTLHAYLDWTQADFAARPLVVTDGEVLDYGSVAALSRKLASEGTSFRAVKEEVRRDVAIQRLVKTREPIDLIAASVGFDNTPAFHRAFRTWTGSTPRGYRLRASSD